MYSIFPCIFVFFVKVVRKRFGVVIVRGCVLKVVYINIAIQEMVPAFGDVEMKIV